MPILVTDFDGTFTRRDFFDLIIERHDPPGARAAWQRFVDGEASHLEGIAGVFASLRTDAAGVEDLVTALDPAPGTAAAVRRLQAEGWEVVVASAGCRWYIDRLLERMGLELAVHACPGVWAPDTGLVMKPDPALPFFDAAVGTDKVAVVQDALVRDPVVAYAGDSNTDRAASLLVPAERRFITGWLGRRYEDEGIEFVGIEKWSEIVARLESTKG